MALTKRQQRFYKHRISVYRQSRAGDGKTLKPNETPVLTNVPCYLVTTSEFQQVSEIGSTKQENFLTSDKFSMELGVDVRAGDYIQITAGPTAVGNWYLVKGRPEEHGLRANKQAVMALECVSPFV